MAEGRTLSVIVPVYDVAERFLAECFESILGQDFSDYELIIIDDGAKDDLETYIDSYDYRGADVHIIHQENRGVAVARNEGLRLATGEYVTFIDSDDHIEQGCFSTITDFAKKNLLDVLMFGIYLDRGGKRKEFSPYLTDIPLFSDKQKEEAALKCLVGILPFYECPPASADAAGSACAKLYRNEFLKSNGLLYTPGLKRAEDMEFNLRAIDKAENVGYLYRFYYVYRQLETSATFVYRPNGIEVFSDSLHAIREYITSSIKTDLFMQVYYMRCMFFFLESMDMDYLNPKNPDPLFVRLRKLKERSKQEPYKEAFANLRGEHLIFARKIPLFFIRHGMIVSLALFYTVYRMFTGR